MSKKVTLNAVNEGFAAAAEAQSKRGESLEALHRSATESGARDTASKAEKAYHNVQARLERSKRWAELSPELQRFMVRHVADAERAAWLADASSIYGWDTVIKLGRSALTGEQHVQACVIDFIHAFKSSTTIDRAQVIGKLRRNDGALLGAASQNTWTKNSLWSLWVFGAAGQHGTKGGITYTIDPTAPVLRMLREANVVKALPEVSGGSA